MEIFRAEILINEKHILAEGPVWDEQEKILHYVDIKSNMVLILVITIYIYKV